MTSLKQQLIEEAATSSSPIISALHMAQTFVEAATQMDIEDSKNIEVKVGLFNDSIDRMIAKLESLKS